MGAEAPSLVQTAKLLGVKPFPKQAEILAAIDSGRYREIVLCLGRRSGKDVMAAIAAIQDACFRDLRPYLRRRERRHVVCVAASREQAGQLLDTIRSLLEGTPLAEALVEETTNELLIRQPATGAPVTIRTVPCSARTSRGLTASTVILNEFAHYVTETEGPACAERVQAALVPATATFKGDARVIYMSTPWGNTNLFARLFQLASEDGRHPHMLAYQAPTWEMRPDLDEQFFASVRAQDPDLYQGEYGAEFLASGDPFLDYGRIQAAVDESRFELPVVDTKRPVAALDPAFSSDPFALAIVGRHHEDTTKLRLALLRSWQPPRARGESLEFEQVLDEIADLCRTYQVGTAITDQHASVPVRQHLAKRGVSCRELTMGVGSKTAIYSSLKAKLYAGELELYRHETLLKELSRIEAVYSAGSARIQIPRIGSSHGDCAQALAMAVYEQAQRGYGGGRRRPRPPGGRRDSGSLTAGLIDRAF